MRKVSRAIPEGDQAFRYEGLQPATLEEWEEAVKVGELDVVHNKWLEGYIKACGGWRGKRVTEKKEIDGVPCGAGEGVVKEGVYYFNPGGSYCYPAEVYRASSIVASSDPTVNTVTHTAMSCSGVQILATPLVPMDSTAPSPQPYLSIHTKLTSLGSVEVSGDIYGTLDCRNVFVPKPTTPCCSRLDVIKYVEPGVLEDDGDAGRFVEGDVVLNTAREVRESIRNQGVKLKQGLKKLLLSLPLVSPSGSASSSATVVAEMTAQILKKVVKGTVLGTPEGAVEKINKVYHHALSQLEWSELVVPLACGYYDVPTERLPSALSKSLQRQVAYRLCELLGCTIVGGKIHSDFCITGCRSTSSWWAADVKKMKRRVEASRQAKHNLQPLTETLIHVLHLTSPDPPDPIQHEADQTFFTTDLLKLTPTPACLLRTASTLDKYDALPHLEQAASLASPTPLTASPTQLIEKLLSLTTYSVVYLSVKGERCFEDVRQHLLDGHAVWRHCLEKGYLDEALAAGEGAKVVHALSKGFQMRDEFEKALPFAQEARKLTELWTGKGTEEVGVAATELGHVIMSLGDMDGAVGEFRTAVDIYGEVYGDNHIYTATALNNLACLEYSKARKAAKAKGAQRSDYADACERVKDLFKRIVNMPMETLSSAGGDESVLVNALTSLANVELLLGNVLGAEPLCLRAIKEAEDLFEPTHPDAVAAHRTLNIIKTRKRILAAVKIQSQMRRYLAAAPTRARLVTLRLTATTLLAVAVASTPTPVEATPSPLSRIFAAYASRCHLGTLYHTRTTRTLLLQQTGRGYASRLRLATALASPAASIEVLQKTGRGMLARVVVRALKQEEPEPEPEPEEAEEEEKEEVQEEAKPTEEDKASEVEEPQKAEEEVKAEEEEEVAPEAEEVERAEEVKDAESEVGEAEEPVKAEEPEPEPEEVKEEAQEPEEVKVEPEKVEEEPANTDEVNEEAKESDVEEEPEVKEEAKEPEPEPVKEEAKEPEPEPVKEEAKGPEPEPVKEEVKEPEPELEPEPKEESKEPEPEPEPEVVNEPEGDEGAKDVAATTVQKWGRGYVGRVKLSTVRGGLWDSAGSVLQRVGRGCLARKEMSACLQLAEKNRLAAAGAIQRVYRGSASRAGTKADMERRERVYTDKRTDLTSLDYDYDRQQVAARRIQACQRGKEARNGVRREKAAVMIQKNVKGYLTRKAVMPGNAEVREERDEKARVIQAEYKRHVEEEEGERCVREGAAILIQSHWKGSMEREAYKRDKEQMLVEMARRKMLRERKERKARVLREKEELQSRISVNSRRAQGAVVSIFLPRAGQSPSRSPPAHHRGLTTLPEVRPPSQTPLYSHYHAATIRDIKKRASKVALNRLLNRAPTPLPWVANEPSPVR